MKIYNNGDFVPGGENPPIVFGAEDGGNLMRKIPRVRTPEKFCFTHNARFIIIDYEVRRLV